MNYEEKKQNIIKMLGEIQKEITQLQRVVQEKTEEFLRLQGEYRLLEKLELEKKEDKK